ncbi:hypothetical protein QZJ86_14245 [Methylomonas montana]|uniref:hypothetical protein n=1 Tax=Methylomonas montana TaxID=3058963 RepID=UPI0026583298|nr:hypothetical protein [Methylomonas montana]WKJ89179.1 hypothetical protein QZJ86_14245 [Methylomonas montana]
MQIGYPADLSARRPKYFLLRGQKKVFKEKATRNFANFLRFCENHPWFSPSGPAYRLFKFAPGKFVAFGEGFPKGHPAPAENERHPCRSPFGLFSPKAAMLGAE